MQKFDMKKDYIIQDRPNSLPFAKAISIIFLKSAYDEMCAVGIVTLKEHVDTTGKQMEWLRLNFMEHSCSKCTLIPKLFFSEGRNGFFFIPE